MRLEVRHQIALDALDGMLQSAQEPSIELFAKLISGVCTRISHQVNTEASDGLTRLAKIGAWTDAAFTLIASELPLWRVRRVAYEDGEWHCSLSCQPNLPIAFDDCVDATHEVLPLAMLRAFVQACRKRHDVHESVSTVPDFLPGPEQIICCDNYR